MSPTAQTLLNVIVTVVLGLALWFLLSIGGWLLHTGLAKFAPQGLGDAVRRILSFSPMRRDLIGGYLSRLSSIHERIFGEPGTRLILERRHRLLDSRLSTLRADLNQRLLSVEAASSGGPTPTLMTLLQGFRVDVRKAQQFEGFDDDLLDKTTEYQQARGRLLWCLVGSLVIGGFNSMLLYIFFREFEVGIFIPLTRVDAIIMAPLLLPAAEFLTGFFTEYLSDDEKHGFGAQLTKWLVVAALAGVEYFVFYLLFKNIFENADIAQYAGIAVPLLSLAGPALTLLQAMIGSGAGRAKRLLGRLGARQTIKDDIREANRFVEGLPARYTKITNTALNATRAVDQLANDLHGQEEANLPVASAVEDQRRLFVKAIDSVNPTHWAGTVAGEAEDGRDVARYAWLLPPAVLIVATALILLLERFLARAPAIGPESAIGRWAAAAAVAAVCFIGGGFLFRRVGVATQSGNDTRDVLFPRDELFRIVTLVAGVLLGIAILAAGYIADGRFGLVEGLVAVAAGIALSILGSSPDLIARGVSFLALVAFVAAITLIEAAVLALTAIAVGASALLFTLIYVVVFLIGWPLIMLLERLRRPRTPQTNRPMAAEAAL